MLTKSLAIEVVLESDHRYRGCVHDYTQPQDNNPVYVSSSYSTYEDAENVAKRWIAARNNMTLGEPARCPNCGITIFYGSDATDPRCSSCQRFD